MISNRSLRDPIRYGVPLSVSLLILVITAYAGAPSLGSEQTADTSKAGLQNNRDLPTLEIGRPVERELAGGEAHSYLLTLTAGQFCHVVVDQRGIDVVVSFYGLDGAKMVEVDTPTDTNGQEPISLVAENSGVYRLEVRSLAKNAPSGRYEVKLEELRAATPEDRSRVTAQKAFTDAKSLRNQRTAESFRKAIKMYQEALVVWQTLGDRLMQAYSLNEMGLIYGDVGEYQKALDSYSQARTIYKAISDFRSEASMLVNIGWIYGMLGEDQKALDLYDQVQQAYRAIGDRNADPVLLSNIGATYASLGQYPKALDIHLRVLAIRRARSDSGGQAITLNNIANCYEHLGEKLKALDYYGQALTLMPQLGNAFYTATTLNHIGALYQELGEHQKALDYFGQALVIRQTIGDRNGEAATLFYFARLERDRGNFVEARNRIEAALAAVESLRINVMSQQLRASFFASVRKYNEFYVDLMMRLHQQHPSAGFDAAAFQASEKGRARSLLELLTEAGAEIRQGVNASLVERERDLRQSISDKADRQLRLLSGAHSENQVTTVAKEIAALTSDYDLVLAEMRETSPRYAALTQPVPLSLNEIQTQLLDENTLLLEYALGENKSFVWAVTPTSIKSFALPSQAEIEAAARRVYDLVTASDQSRKNENAEQRRKRLDQADADYPAAATAMSRMLLEPLASELGNKRLLIIGEGVLQYVPFAALPEPPAPTRKPDKLEQNNRQQIAEGPPPLIVHHEIISLPSASVLGVLRREAAGRPRPAKALAVFADPVFDTRDARIALNGKNWHAENNKTSQLDEVKRSADDSGLNGFPRLRFSRMEADQIVRLTPANKSWEALDFAANREAATSPELQQYRIVHFATHGLINNKHTELSGIVLSLVNERGQAQNGFLRLYDIYNLNLKADLVVLSACQTALGKDIKGEGLVGLTRAFMYAGATRVVASLWQTEDRATAALMSRFYEGMLVGGLTPAAALRKAQLSMWEDKRWRQTRYWAAFTLQGEWK